jgi:hypothetical protein
MAGDPGRTGRRQAETLDPAVEELDRLAADIEPALAIGPDPGAAIRSFATDTVIRPRSQAGTVRSL